MNFDYTAENIFGSPLISTPLSVSLPTKSIQVFAIQNTLFIYARPFDKLNRFIYSHINKKKEIFLEKNAEDLHNWNIPH